MTTCVIQTDQLVSIEVPSSGAPPVRASVVHVRDGEILVRCPELPHAPAGFEASRGALLTVTDTAGVHRATTYILRVLKCSPLTFGLDQPTSFTTTQNRQFFRINVRLAVDFSVTASAHPPSLALQNQKAQTCDISAGGLRFETATPLMVGDEIRVRIPIPIKKGAPSAQPLEATAKVVRAVPGPADRRFTIGVAFQQMAERERERLVRFMFDLQIWTRS